jgi:hypothetical protein
MAQVMRPPASPVGSVLSDTHSMNHQSDCRGLPPSRRGRRFPSTCHCRRWHAASSWSRLTRARRFRSTGRSTSEAIPPRTPKRGSKARCCQLAGEGRDAGLMVELLAPAHGWGFEASSFFVDGGDKPRIGQAFLVIDPGDWRAARSTTRGSRPCSPPCCRTKMCASQAIAGTILPTGPGGRV